MQIRAPKCQNCVAFNCVFCVAPPPLCSKINHSTPLRTYSKTVFSTHKFLLQPKLHLKKSSKIGAIQGVTFLHVQALIITVTHAITCYHHSYCSLVFCYDMGCIVGYVLCYRTIYFCLNYYFTWVSPLNCSLTRASHKSAYMFILQYIVYQVQ